jgi:hypothetical protein
MEGFVRIERPYRDNLLQIIVQNIPVFERSDELRQLDESERKVPGLVASAFREFIVAELNKDKTSSTVTACFQLIEKLCAVNDPDIENTIVLDVLQGLAIVRTDDLLSHLGPCATKLYLRWVAD